MNKPAHDSETGEIYEAAGPRRRRVPTDEERAIGAERRAQRGRMLAAVEALASALAVEGDPPVRDMGAPLIDVSHAREVEPVLRIARPSGRGGPGSALVVSLRDYDGANGGEPTRYLLLYVEFFDGGSFKCRTRGVRILLEDLPALVTALTKPPGERFDAFEP